MSNLAIARKAVKAAIKTVGRDFSALHRVAIDTLIARGLSAAVATDLGWEAVKDVLLGY